MDIIWFNLYVRYSFTYLLATRTQDHTIHWWTNYNKCSRHVLHLWRTNPQASNLHRARGWMLKNDESQTQDFIILWFGFRRYLVPWCVVDDDGYSGSRRRLLIVHDGRLSEVKMMTLVPLSRYFPYDRRWWCTTTSGVPYSRRRSKKSISNCSIDWSDSKDDMGGLWVDCGHRREEAAVLQW